MTASVTSVGRSLCPVCGAPMTPGTSEQVTACEWCGSRSHVVRRLRTIEPIAVGGFEPGLVVGRSDENHSGGARSDGPLPGEDVVACSGCAGPITTNVAQEIVACPQCGTHTKIERLLEAEQEGEPADYPEPRHRLGFMRSRRIARDEERDAALRALLDEADLDRIFRQGN